LRAIRDGIRKDGILKTIKRLIIIRSFTMFYILDLKPGKKYHIYQSAVPDLEITPVYMPISLHQFELRYESGDGGDFREFEGKWEYDENIDGTYAFWVSSQGKFVHLASFGTSLAESEYLRVQDAYELHGNLDRGYSTTGGFATTAPEFRRKGVYSHVVTWIYEYLRDKGFKRVLSLYRGYVVGPQKVQRELGSRLIGKIELVQLFGFLFYRKYIMARPNKRVFYRLTLSPRFSKGLKA
jgi:GNAT superfamily N-acetyltransferase